MEIQKRVGCWLWDVGIWMLLFFEFCGEAMSEPGVPEEERWKKDQKKPPQEDPLLQGGATLRSSHL